MFFDTPSVFAKGHWRGLVLISKPMKIDLRLFLTASLLAFLAGAACPQISIAPTSLYIHDDTNIGTLYVSNNSEQPQEVTVSLAFGYPGSDDAGNMVMLYEDSAAYEKYALNDWVRVFPRTFVVAPGQQQTVRLQVRPKKGLEDGVYWTRIKVLSNPQTPEVVQTVTETISTRITFKFEQVIAAFYLSGKTTTGLVIQGVESVQDGSKLALLARVQRTGNSPFIGSLRAELYDSGGALVRQQESTTAIYFDAIRRIEMDVLGIPPGNYQARIFFETRRGDVAPTDLVQAESLNTTTAVILK